MTQEPTPTELLQRVHVTTDNVMMWWEQMSDAVLDEEYYRGRHRDPDPWDLDL